LITRSWNPFPTTLRACNLPGHLHATMENVNMQVRTETLDNGVIRVNLDGRLDILGAQAIEVKFTALTTIPGAAILVDLSEVAFLASLGMRALLATAKGASMRGGRMVLYRPQPNVREVLDTSGLSSLIQVYDELREALDALHDISGR
jgi:anti-anti-sigma factor